ncbi:MAG: hypothetical protein K1X67_16215 [Fimbriimonadaceae bacterium]|nr:hypothetical protein [Fimbriimonadaceae bacterium]
MAKAEIFAGWTEWRFRKAKEALLDMGFVLLHRKGRRFGRRNEPDQFVFGDRM